MKMQKVLFKTKKIRYAIFFKRYTECRKQLDDLQYYKFYIE